MPTFRLSGLSNEIRLAPTRNGLLWEPVTYTDFNTAVLANEPSRRWTAGVKHFRLGSDHASTVLQFIQNERNYDERGRHGFLFVGEHKASVIDER